MRYWILLGFTVAAFGAGYSFRPNVYKHVMAGQGETKTINPSVSSSEKNSSEQMQKFSTSSPDNSENINRKPQKQTWSSSLEVIQSGFVARNTTQEPQPFSFENKSLHNPDQPVSTHVQDIKKKKNAAKRLKEASFSGKKTTKHKSKLTQKKSTTKSPNTGQALHGSNQRKQTCQIEKEPTKLANSAMKNQKLVSHQMQKKRGK